MRHDVIQTVGSTETLRERITHEPAIRSWQSHSHALERATPPHTRRTYTLTETSSINTCSRVEISVQGNIKTHVGTWPLGENNAFRSPLLLLTWNKPSQLMTLCTLHRPWGSVQHLLTYPLSAGLLVERPHPRSLPVLSEWPEGEKWGQETLNSSLGVASAQPVPEQQAPHSSRQRVVREAQGQLPRHLSAPRGSAAPPGPQQSLRELNEPCEHNQERDAKERHQDRPAYVLNVHRLPWSLGSHFQHGLERLIHQRGSLRTREREWLSVKKKNKKKRQYRAHRGNHLIINPAECLICKKLGTQREKNNQ